MTPREQMPPRDPVARFVEAATAWREAMSRNDSRTANKHHDRALIPMLREAIIGGPDSISRFVNLVDHQDDGVALWAACFALHYDPSRAERALQRLSKDPSLYISFSAEMTLKEWKKGTLEVAWLEKV